MRNYEEKTLKIRCPNAKTAKATPAKAKQPKKVVTEELRKLAKRVI